MGLFDAFTGKSQRRDLTQAAEIASRERGRALETFEETSEEFLGRAINPLRPDIEFGRSAIDPLSQLLGLGDGTSVDAVNALLQDPVLQATIARGVETADAGAAARGTLRSGAQLRRLSEIGREESQNFIRQRINDLFRVAATGQGAAAQESGLTFATGQQIGQAQFGTGQQEAASQIALGNALAESRSLPINNLIGLLSAGARFAGALGGGPAGSGAV